MVIKGMSYALNNPTKEILYQVIRDLVYLMKAIIIAKSIMDFDDSRFR